MEKLKICICGGGALGHVISATLASRDDYQVNLLTGHPDQWEEGIAVSIPGGAAVTGKLARISSDAREVVSGVDYVILCLPGYVIASTLRKIVPFLKKGAIVGSVVSSNGFFWMARSILPKGNPYFGLQRVPYIARVLEYGHHAELKGCKNEIKVAVSQNGNKEVIRQAVETFFAIRTVLLRSFWAAALTNSNPLLHTARLYILFKDYTPGIRYKEAPLFYEDWDEDSSKLLIACDHEFQQILQRLPLGGEVIASVLTHYDSVDSKSLTSKLKSIEAFKGIRLDMLKTADGFIPNWYNRYFTEDIPYGLLIVKSIAAYFGLQTPSIDKILYWAQVQMGKEYLINGSLSGRDMPDTGVLDNYVASIKELLGVEI